jgi:hypothetical protein
VTKRIFALVELESYRETKVVNPGESAKILSLPSIAEAHTTDLNPLHPPRVFQFSARYAF